MRVLLEEARLLAYGPAYHRRAALEAVPWASARGGGPPDRGAAR